MCNCCQIVSENIRLKNEKDILKNRIKELEWKEEIQLI